MTEQSISSLLSTVATVAFVKTSSLGLWRLDKQASKESDRAHNAVSGAGKTSACRLAGAEGRIKTLSQLQGKGRVVLTECTTAWGDRRLLANTLIETLMKNWKPVKQEFDEVSRLNYDAPSLIAQAHQNKGSYNVDIPTEDEIRNAFTLEFQMEPVPDASKFNSNILDKDLESELRRRFEANIQAAYVDAQHDAVQRIAKPLQTLVERMTAYNEKESEKAKGLTVGPNRLYDSVIGNIQEVADVFGSWNLTGDPWMAKLDDALSAFSGIEAEDLKKHKDLRDDTAKRAEAILEQIRAGGYL